MNFILSNKLKKYTNDKRKLSAIISIAAIIVIVAAIVINNNYKVVYKVTLDGNVLGYVNNKEEFTCMIKNEVLNQQNSDMELVALNSVPEFSATIVSSNTQTEETSIIKLLKLKAEVTYKLYAITLDGEDRAYVASMDEAQEEVNKLTEQYSEKLESEFGIREVYTNNPLEYKDMKYATIAKLDDSISSDIEAKEEAERAEAERKAQEEAEAKKKAQKEAEARRQAEAEESYSYKYVEAEEISDTDVNGVEFKNAPVTGNISSRYGANESVRNHTHKGIDIAASNGTSIFAVADGVVEYAQYNNGGYGNLVIISHGNGVQTYYAHCSALMVSAGDTVSAGDVIAAVGSTGNSTGNHLHFEVRIDGTQVNPQNYVYQGN